MATNDDFNFEVSSTGREDKNTENKFLMRQISSETSYEDFVKGMEFADTFDEKQRNSIVYQISSCCGTDKNKMKYIVRRGIFDGDDIYAKGLEHNPDIEQKIEVYIDLLKEQKDFDLTRMDAFSRFGGMIIRRAQNSEQISRILATDQEFCKKKLSDADYEYLESLKKTEKESSYSNGRFFREHAMVGLYLNAVLNPCISDKDMKYALAQTAKIKDDDDRSNVVGAALHNKNLRPEHYDAIIDCFSDGPITTESVGMSVLQLKDISLEQVQRFGQIISRNTANYPNINDVDLVKILKAEVARKKIELQKAEKQQSESRHERKAISSPKTVIGKGPDLEI